MSPGPEAQADFGIAKAIEQDDVRGGAAGAGARRLMRARSPFMILGQLRSRPNGSRPARVPAAIGAVLRTDLALKSSGGEATVLLERLVVELCSTARHGSARDVRRQPRLVAAGGVAVDDALGGHLVHDRHGLAQRRLGRVHVLAVERGADRLERRAQGRPHLADCVPVA